MKITVLGSGSAVLVPERQASAYLIESRDNYYLLEAGDGVTGQLIRYNLELPKINSVFISHTHADHAAGIIMLIQTMQQIKRTLPLEIYIPDSLLPGFESILPYFQIYKEKLSFDLNFKGITPQTLFKRNDFQIQAVANDHLQGNQTYASQRGLRVSSFSFLIREKTKQVIFTSDINDFDHLKSYTDQIDLLISECTHVLLPDIKTFAQSQDIKKVLLSHIPPEIHEKQLTSENLSSPKVHISIAQDGQEIEV
ncbi:MAG: MBL fold metallo-hydrolase [bacterium]